MCAAPAPLATDPAAVRAVAHALWPSTLTKFWGGTRSRGVALLSFAFATPYRRGGHRYAIALAAANLALAVLLYRNAEEAGVAHYPPPVARRRRHGGTAAHGRRGSWTAGDAARAAPVARGARGGLSRLRDQGVE